MSSVAPLPEMRVVDFSVTLALRTRFLRMPRLLGYKALCQSP